MFIKENTLEAGVCDCDEFGIAIAALAIDSFPLEHVVKMRNSKRSRETLTLGVLLFKSDLEVVDDARPCQLRIILSGHNAKIDRYMSPGAFAEATRENEKHKLVIGEVLKTEWIGFPRVQMRHCLPVLNPSVKGRNDGLLRVEIHSRLSHGLARSFGAFVLVDKLIDRKVLLLTVGTGQSLVLTMVVLRVHKTEAWKLLWVVKVLLMIFTSYVWTGGRAILAGGGMSFNVVWYHSTPATPFLIRARGQIVESIEQFFGSRYRREDRSTKRTGADS